MATIDNLSNAPFGNLSILIVPEVILLASNPASVVAIEALALKLVDTEPVTAPVNDIVLAVLKFDTDGVTATT